MIIEKTHKVGNVSRRMRISDFLFIGGQVFNANQATTGEFLKTNLKSICQEIAAIFL